MRIVKTVGVKLLYWYIPTDKKRFSLIISINGNIAIDQHDAYTWSTYTGIPYVHKNMYNSLKMLHFIFMYHLSIRWRCDTQHGTQYSSIINTDTRFRYTFIPRVTSVRDIKGRTRVSEILDEKGLNELDHWWEMGQIAFPCWAFRPNIKTDAMYNWI